MGNVYTFLFSSKASTGQTDMDERTDGRTDMTRNAAYRRPRNEQLHFQRFPVA